MTLRERRDRALGIVREAIACRPTGLALAVGLVLVIRTALVQLASLALPLHFAEGHNWRESFTYGVAWNYAHGAVDVLHPRMFVVFAKSNIVPMEPPLYPLVSSFLLRVTGDSVVGPRVLSWLALVVVVVVLWKWVSGAPAAEGQRAELGWPERAGLLLFLGLTPLVAVEFRQLQPEPTCAGLATAAAWFASRYGVRERGRDAWVAVALAGLAVLVKPVALGVLPGIVAFGAYGPLRDGAWRRCVRRGLVLSAGIAVVLVPYVAWDRWSHHLQATEMNGAFFIAIEHDPKQMLKNALSAAYAREALLFFLPSYAGVTWLAPAFVAGAYRSIADARLRRFAVPLGVWLVGYMVELLAVGDRLHSNAYYFILAPVPVGFFTAVGMGAMLRVLGAERRLPMHVFQPGLVAAVLVPIGTLFVRNWRWTNTTDLAALGLEKNRALWGEDLGVARMLIGFLVLYALAPRLRPRRVPEPVAVVLSGIVLGTGLWAARDQAQYFRYYVAADRREGYVGELAELRREVDRHSTREDLIVTAPGWSPQSPNMLLFWLALRNGFPVHTGEDPMAVTAFRDRGAKLYLRVELPGEARGAMPGKLVGQGPWWRLTCIAAEGCPPR